MSHFVLSQGKFVFAIFACDHELDHEFIARVTLTNNMVDTRVTSRSDGKCQNVIKINKVATIWYIKYLVGGRNELFVAKFIDECVYKIVLHIHRLRCMAWITLTNKMAGTRVSSRPLAYAYQKFVTEISRSETSGRICNL